MSGPMHVCLMMVNRWAYVYVRGLKPKQGGGFWFWRCTRPRHDKSRPRRELCQSL